LQFRAPAAVTDGPGEECLPTGRFASTGLPLRGGARPAPAPPVAGPAVSCRGTSPHAGAVFRKRPHTGWSSPELLRRNPPCSILPAAHGRSAAPRAAARELRAWEGPGRRLALSKPPRNQQVGPTGGGGPGALDAHSTPGANPPAANQRLGAPAVAPCPPKAPHSCERARPSGGTARRLESGFHVARRLAGPRQVGPRQKPASSPPQNL